jgi:hypothetical protein
MPFPRPPSPLTATALLGLQGTVVLLLLLLIKARLQIKVFSALGIFLALMQTLALLSGAGVLGLTALAMLLKSRPDETV